MPVNLVAFLALVLTSLALIPSGAHLFALPNKIGLARDAYLVAQSIYRGWALFGVVLVPAIVVVAVLAVVLRRDRPAGALAAAAAGLLALTLLVFFAAVYPGNVATENWTVMPENWQALRLSWEYGHAANAVLTFLAQACLFAAVLTRR